MGPSPRAEKYADLQDVYSQCSGPGALRTAEFVADKIGLQAGMRVLDAGRWISFGYVIGRRPL